MSKCGYALKLPVTLMKITFEFGFLVSYENVFDVSNERKAKLLHVLTIICKS